ncbi:hypothetical protein LXA43DRAFT_894908 [Ganoderma leucocontextum]|nr:hypothetical protein LXA43DRAFT_894908 [Ganoderma leucocontextum]
MHFVPGGCTPILQACDVSIQRLLKHSLKHSYHRDVVNEVLAQLDEGRDTITVAKNIGVLRDRSVTWIWNAFNTLNDPRIVKKAFEQCAIGDLNLSYESLTSREARDRLRDLKITDRAFWDELTAYDRQDEVPAEDAVVPEDSVEEESGETTGLEDDSNIPVDALIALVVDGIAPTGASASPETGALMSTAATESSEEPEAGVEHEGGEEELGRGKRKRVKRDLAKYNGEQFW